MKQVSNDSPKSALVPRDLLFASASGHDLHISVQGALHQIPRIARARRIDRDVLTQLVDQHSQPKLWGFIGTEKINVIELNEGLEKLEGKLIDRDVNLSKTYMLR